MYKYRFCYRLTEQAEVANDGEGKPAEAFTQMSFTTKKELPPEKEKKIHEETGPLSISEQLGIPAEFIIPITTEEYDEEMEEDS